jgi:hypothetical protein
MVGGNGWTQPSTWNDTWYDTSGGKVSNATGWATLTDPLGSTIVSVHTYFDADGGGAGTDIASNDIIVQRLQPVVNWARSKGLKVHLSEFGASTNASGAQTAVSTTCDYIRNNSDVLIGWSWWAYGPPSWWGGYQFTLCPKSNYTVDDPKIAWLKPYFAPLQNPADFVDSSTSPPTTPPLNIVKTTTTAKSPGDQGKNFTKTVGSGQAVPAGTYTLKTAIRTTFGDQTGFSVNIFLQNDHSNVDFVWEELHLDLRGHTLDSVWNATAEGTDSNGFTIFKPTNDTKTVRALNRNSFGFYLKRATNEARDYQVLAKTIKW